MENLGNSGLLSSSSKKKSLCPDRVAVVDPTLNIGLLRSASVRVLNACVMLRCVLKKQKNAEWISIYMGIPPTDKVERI